MDLGFFHLAVIAVAVIIVVKLVQLIRQHIQLEKALAAFPVAPDRHWLLGHLPHVSFPF